MLKALIWILGTYLFFNLYAIILSHFFLFSPPQKAKFKKSAVTKFIPTKYGEIQIIDLPSANAKYTVLFSHGNAENLKTSLPLLKEINKTGYRVVSYDYNGYGQSDGKSSEQAVYADINAVYHYLIQQKIPAKKIIIIGNSLGTAPSIYLAAHKPNAGVILLSPLLSAFRSKIKVPWPFFFGDSFNNSAFIDKITSPLFIVHAPSDRVVLYSNGTRLYKLANEPKKLITIHGQGHNLGWQEIQLGLNWLNQQFQTIVTQ